MNVAVAVTGYVSMSISTLLAKHNYVTSVGCDSQNVEKINNKIPIQDDYIERIKANGTKFIIYEPTIADDESFFGSLMVKCTE